MMISNISNFYKANPTSRIIGTALGGGAVGTFALTLLTALGILFQGNLALTIAFASLSFTSTAVGIYLTFNPTTKEINVDLKKAAEAKEKGKLKRRDKDKFPDHDQRIATPGTPAYGKVEIKIANSKGQRKVSRIIAFRFPAGYLTRKPLTDAAAYGDKKQTSFNHEYKEGFYTSFPRPAGPSESESESDSVLDLTGPGRTERRYSV